MNFMLCQNVFNLESLFQCFGGGKEQNEKKKDFTLVIDRKIASYPYSLDKLNARVSLIDLDLKYINDAQTGKVLPPIFLKKHTKGESISTVIHPSVLPFYKNLLISTFNERSTIKLHIILNNIHILISTIPVYDHQNKLIAVTLFETPYNDVEESS